jgi:hypothetical protein
MCKIKFLYSIFIFTLSIFINQQALCVEKSGFEKFLYNNMSYDMPRAGDFTEKNIKNGTYKIHVYGNISNESFVDDPPYTLVKFTNGKGELQNAMIEHIAVGNLTDQSQHNAAFVLSSFDGFRHDQLHLCVISERENSYHVNQVLIENTDIRITGVKIKDKQIILNILKPGLKDPGCCPTVKDTVTFTLTNDKISEVQAGSAPRTAKSEPAKSSEIPSGNSSARTYKVGIVSFAETAKKSAKCLPYYLKASQIHRTSGQDLNFKTAFEPATQMIIAALNSYGKSNNFTAIFFIKSYDSFMASNRRLSTDDLAYYDPATVQAFLDLANNIGKEFITRLKPVSLDTALAASIDRN